MRALASPTNEREQIRLAPSKKEPQPNPLKIITQAYEALT
jgi:hypothetical protein